MWNKLPYAKPLFLSYSTENGYRIYVTDYVNIWWVLYQENEFLNLLKKCNDDLEVENDNQLLQLGLKMLKSPENLKKLHVTFEEKTLSVSMLLSHEYPLFLDMKLSEGSREMFFKIITQQLLKTVHDLKTSENELRFSLIKKDKEIEEYKTETDVRLAMYLKTRVFCDEEHMGKHPMYENNFGTLEFFNCLLENVIEATEDQVIVKQENLQINESRLKVEPDAEGPIKTELNILANDTQNLTSSTQTIKREIKNEPQNIISPKKKPKKLLRI